MSGHHHSHHHHHHHHDHDHDNGHDHDHGHAHDHGIGHNHHDPASHLHSHVHGPKDRTDELKVLSASFVEGFRSAEDKASYLRLAGIPLQRPGADGLTLHLVDAAIASRWQVGTASPAFASRELVYLPYPGEMIAGRETMTFTYVSLTERQDVDLVTLLADRLAVADPDAA